MPRDDNLSIPKEISDKMISDCMGAIQPIINRVEDEHKTSFGAILVTLEASGNAKLMKGNIDDEIAAHTLATAIKIILE